jgi:hypothetical protein
MSSTPPSTTPLDNPISPTPKFHFHWTCPRSSCHSSHHLVPLSNFLDEEARREYDERRHIGQRYYSIPDEAETERPHEVSTCPLDCKARQVYVSEVATVQDQGTGMEEWAYVGASCGVCGVRMEKVGCLNQIGVEFE